MPFRWQTNESNDFIPYSHHPYAYALGNPVSLTDPTGKCVPYVEQDCRPFWETGGGLNWADGGQYAWDVFQGIGSPGAIIADGLGLSDGHATERIFREGGVGTYLGAGFTGLTLVAAAPTVVIRGQAFLMTHPVAAATLSAGTGALALGGTGYTAYQGIICNDPYAQTALANPGALGLPYMWQELGEALLAAKQGLPVVGQNISERWQAYNAEAQKLRITPKDPFAGGSWSQRIRNWVADNIRGYRTVPIDFLIPNPGDEFTNPRIGPSNEALRRHREIIAHTGQIEEPIQVYEVEDGYLIQNGHHRWLAAQQMGLEQVPVKVLK